MQKKGQANVVCLLCKQEWKVAAVAAVCVEEFESWKIISSLIMWFLIDLNRFSICLKSWKKMGLKLSTKRRRGRSYSFTEKDKPTSEVANDSTVTTNGGGGGKGSKKSKRSVSSAAKFSSTARETYVPKVCYSCFCFVLLSL